MIQRQNNRALKSVSLIVTLAAIAGIAFVAQRDYRDASRRGSGTVVPARTSGREHPASAGAAEEPAITYLDLPTLNQSNHPADADADATGAYGLPLYDARVSVNPALLAAQRLAAERAAFAAIGSPGPAMPAVVSGAMPSMGGGAAQASNGTGLALGLLTPREVESDQDRIRKATQTDPHFGWILIAGGQGGGKLALSRAELFNPTQMDFVPTGSMHWPRSRFAASDLSTGETLVAGGEDAQGRPIASAEIYDPVAGAFSATGNMTTPRAGQTATLISGCGCGADGKILVAGGTSTRAGTPLASAELYDPASGTFTPTGAMNHARAWQTASLIGSGADAGDILIAGGIGAGTAVLSSAELYDPRTGAFTETASMFAPRAYHTATWLNPQVSQGEFSGRILIAGGWNGDSVNASAEIFDPSGETFIPTARMTTAREYQAAVLMGNGQVLIAGGQKLGDQVLASAELYDPGTESFIPTEPMKSVHVGAVASMLPNGSVLIAGGRSDNAEVYNPARGTFRLSAAMPVDVAYAAGAILAR